MRGWEIGRLRGIPLEVPPLFVLWTAFLWWSLASGFPRSHLGFPALTYKYMPVGATLLVLASILFHDVVTLSVQKALGAPMPERIVLGPFGAGWKMRGEGSTDPAVVRAELLAGFCGPATYMVLASFFIMAGLFLQRQMPNFLPTRAVFDMVAIANASLAFLNLLPGAPLDAGRILSAIVRRTTNDPARARQAARFGGITIGVWACGLGILGLATVGSMWSFWGIILGTALLEGFAVEGAPDVEGPPGAVPFRAAALPEPIPEPLPEPLPGPLP